MAIFVVVGLVVGPISVAPAGAAGLVTLSGVVRDAAGAPVAGAGVDFDTSGVVTGANGAFVLHVVAGTSSGLSVNLESFGSEPSGDELFGNSDGFTVLADTVRDVQLPAVALVHVHVVDASGAPLANTPIDARPTQAEGAPTTTGSLSDGTPVQYTWDSVGWPYNESCTTDSSGACDLWGLSGWSIPFSARYIAPAGYPNPDVVQGQATFTATSSDVTIGFANYSALNEATIISVGSVQGPVSVSSPPGTEVFNVTGTSLTRALPLGSVPLTGAVAYSVSGVAVGTTIDVVLSLPPGSNPTGVYKFQGGSYVDVSSIASIIGNQITLHLTDGGVGDADALANGVIVDPLVPFRKFALPAPTSLAAIPGNGRVNLSWKAPSTTNGSAINSYEIVPFVGGVPKAAIILGSPATSHAITGLTNGATYVYKVAARNGIGWSALTPSSRVVTVGAPVAPTGVSASPGSMTATVRWIAPPLNGGSPITGYQVAAYVGATRSKILHLGLVTTATLTGLTNSKTYTFRVSATNARESGPQAATTPITVGAPTSPTGARLVSGSTLTTTGSVNVSYAAGANNGAAFTKFTATCKPAKGGPSRIGVHMGATPAAITVTGLTTAKTYTCTVAAANSRGTGPASAATAPIIVGAPAAPAQPIVARITAGTLNVTFGTPTSNGATISGYTATCTSTNGGATRSRGGVHTPIAVAGLTPGKTYTCRVEATNDRGNGPLSGPSAPVIA